MAAPALASSDRAANARLLRFAALPQRSTNLRRFKPQSKATVDLMRTITVIFVLALIAVAGEAYSDHVLMSGSVTAPVDPVSFAVGSTAH
jgi:hypothetical protein